MAEDIRPAHVTRLRERLEDFTFRLFFTEDDVSIDELQEIMEEFREEDSLCAVNASQHDSLPSSPSE